MKRYLVLWNNEVGLGLVRFDCDELWMVYRLLDDLEYELSGMYFRVWDKKFEHWIDL
jgi:hypothetical protein